MKDGDPYYLIHQVHGSEIIRCQSNSPKADGFWTDHRKQVLVIKTADCLPVFIADERRIMGLHMGWRAFTNGIFDKAMNFFKAPNRTQIFIGPHIGRQSFQVDTEIANRILKAQGLTKKIAISKKYLFPSIDKKSHWYVNLAELLKARSRKYQIFKFNDFLVDTYRSPSHYSHRRNRWRQGTNYSFIVKP